MKIGIEAQRLFRKNKHGMDIVALELIRQLQRIDLENEYFIFVKDDEDDNVISESRNCRIIRVPSAPYPLWEQVLLPREVEKQKIDLLHCTSNTSPIRCSVPLVLTLHDIIYLEQWNFTKGSYYQIAGNLYRRWNVPRVVEVAKKIITVSDFERERIQKHFALDPDRVTTVHNGVSEHFFPITDEATRNAIRRKYNIPERYIFFLGNTDPKKNVEGVLRAMSLLKKWEKLDFKLLMPDINRSYLERLSMKIGDSDILSEVVFTGYVPNHDLPAIYSMAKLFIYPSLRESFGIPILEAMACGTPVITSNTSSMPEVAGNAAWLADPSDPSSIAEGIVAILRDKKLAESMRMKGFQRSSCFSWEQNARKTLEVYSSLAE